MSDAMSTPSTVQPDEPREKKPAPRRRLAGNVVCMFDEERPRIENYRRRGPLPRLGNVRSYSAARKAFMDADNARDAAARFKVGDLVKIRASLINPENIGRLVRIYGRWLHTNGSPDLDRWLVDSIDGELLKWGSISASRTLVYEAEVQHVAQAPIEALFVLNPI